MTYYKIENERMVFSTCKVIELNGRQVSNPTAEMIAEAGWLPYTPPVIPPQPQMEPDYTAVMEAVKKMLSTETEALSDEDALDVAALFPTLASKVGKSVNAGERLWWDGRLWKTTQYISELLANWTPDTAVSLFVEVSIEEWPAWRQPLGSADAYNQGDQVSHNDKHWTSDVDGNVWEPGIYGWTEVPQTA